MVSVVALHYHKVVQVRHALLLPLLAPGVGQAVLSVVVLDERAAHRVEHGALQVGQYLEREIQLWMDQIL